MKATPPAVSADVFEDLIERLRRRLTLTPEDRRWLLSAAASGLARAEKDLARRPSAPLERVVAAFHEEGATFGLLDYLIHLTETSPAADLRLALETIALAFLSGDVEAAEIASRQAEQFGADAPEGPHWRAMSLRLAGKNDEAASAFAALAKSLASEEDAPLRAAALANLGLVERALGQLKKAEKAWLKAAELSEALGRGEPLYFNCVQLARLYLICDDLKKAEKMTLRALEIARATGNWAHAADHYYALGLLYTMGEADVEETDEAPRRRTKKAFNDPARAEAVLREALKINERLGRAREEGAAHAALRRILGDAVAAEPPPPRPVKRASSKSRPATGVSTRS